MFKFSIDRGGTFTDVYSECPDGSVKVMKLLSEDPENYPDAPREAIRRIMQEVSLARRPLTRFEKSEGSGQMPVPISYYRNALRNH